MRRVPHPLCKFDCRGEGVKIPLAEQYENVRENFVGEFGIGPVAAVSVFQGRLHVRDARHREFTLPLRNLPTGEDEEMDAVPGRQAVEEMPDFHPGFAVVKDE